MNLVLATRCVRSCSYCFARRAMSRGDAPEFMAWEDAIHAASMLRAAGRTHVSLLGGEPGLHPHFADLLAFLTDLGLELTVFTSGILNEERRESLRPLKAKAEAGRLSFVVNLNDPETEPPDPSQEQDLEAFLDAWGPWCSPGVTITSPETSLSHVFERLLRHAMRPSLRVGMAHPMLDAPSAALADRELVAATKAFTATLPILERLAIRPTLDCGFPLCAFSDVELGRLVRLGAELRFRCDAALDLWPDMTLFHCYPLFGLERPSLFAFDELGAAVEHFHRFRALVREELAGLFPRCETCRHRDAGLCDGGGICRLLRSMMEEAPVRLPEIRNALAHLDPERSR